MDYTGTFDSLAVDFATNKQKASLTITPIDDANVMGWELKVVKPCRMGLRKRSMTELLFCMLRSGR